MESKLIDSIRKKLKDLVLTMGRKGVFSQYCYSEDGEDGVLRAFYEDELPPDGFFIDMGAYHPVHLSNTYWFYERGWRGINIDATPGSMKAFDKFRPRDINLELGVSDEYGQLDFLYYGSTSTINRLVKPDELDSLDDANCKRVKVDVKPVNAILDQYVPKGQHINVISMDVEGLELRILEAFDFDKYSPDFFLIEELDYTDCDFTTYHQSPIYRLLAKHGYIPIAKTQRTVVYRKNNRL